MINQKIAIIGGGFSGLAVAYNILKLTDRILVDIFDDEDFRYNGKAYKTIDENHILNVPADKMGLPFDDENHFYSWLCKKFPGSQISGSDFVLRRYYHLYLQDIISDLKKHKNINFINQKVSDIKFSNQQYELICDHKNFGKYNSVVLACGLEIKPLNRNFKSDKIIDNVWEFLNSKTLPQVETIFIVGSGLTMIDVALSLESKGFKGKIVACSKSGKLPLSHSKDRVQNVPTLEIADANLPLSLIVKKLKNLALNNEWQSVMHSLRPITNAMWQEFDLVKKQRFLRHLMNFWNIHRHRTASSNHEQIMNMINSKKLEIIKGKFQQFEKVGDNIFAKLKNGKTIKIDLALNATGFDFSGQSSDLIRNLLDEKVIVHHKTNLGFDVNRNYNNLYLTGALMIGELLEITAVPDLRNLAHVTSLEIIKNCNENSGF